MLPSLMTGTVEGNNVARLAGLEDRCWTVLAVHGQALPLRKIDARICGISLGVELKIHI